MVHHDLDELEGLKVQFWVDTLIGAIVPADVFLDFFFFWEPCGDLAIIGSAVYLYVVG